LIINIACSARVGLAQSPSNPILDIATWQERLEPNQVEILNTLDELQHHPDIIVKVVPELSAILANGNDATQKLAIRCLEHAGPLPEPTLNLLIETLDHREFGLRFIASQTLRKLGPQVVPKLKIALAAKSPRVRANALVTLNDLITIDIATLDKLQQDPDERVRVVLPRIWLKHGKVGTQKICELTTDSAITVAIAAVRALQYNDSDPEIAVAYLRETVQRPDTYEESVQALTSLGIHAKPAIPDMLSGLRESEIDRDVHRGFDSNVHKALTYIGPARVEDLQRLKESLTFPHPLTQELTANLVGRMGPAATSLAEDLRDAALHNARETKRLKEQEALILDENRRHDFSELNNRYGMACEQSCQSYWRVTRDISKTMALIEQVVTILAEPMFYFDECEFATPEDANVLSTWMQSDNPNLSFTAAEMISKFPISSLTPNQLDTLQNTRGLRWKLKEIATRKSDPIWRAHLLRWTEKEYYSGRLSIHDLADFVKEERLSEPDFLSILRTNIIIGDTYTKTSCLNALATFSVSEADRTEMILQCVRENPDQRRAALEIFLSQEKFSAEQIRFAAVSLSNSDPYTVCKALSLLAKAGPDSISSLEAIKKTPNPNQKSQVRNFEALKLIAICSIENQKIEHQSELVTIFDLTEKEDVNAINLLDDIGARSEFFLPEIERNIGQVLYLRENRRHYLLPALEVLAFIRNDRAANLLQSFENDRDWCVQRYVKHLKRFRETGEHVYFDSEDF